MRALKICLLIAGVGCLLSVFGMFLPLSAWESIAGVFGVKLDLPDSPLLVYMIRLVSATYVAIGLFFIILARDSARYRVMVPFSGLIAVFMGLLCWVTGIASEMPFRWFVSDSALCLVLGFLIIVFWRKAK